MLLKDHSRDELVALLAAVATVEPLFKPSEIAALSKRPRREVLAAIKAGKFGDYFCFGPNSLAVTAGSVNAWRRQFLVPASGDPKGG